MRRMQRRLKVFQHACGGWYLAQEDTAGWHHQPSGCWGCYATAAAATAAATAMAAEVIEDENEEEEAQW